MNTKVTDLEKIMQQLDEYIAEHGNNTNLEKAADQLAELHADLNVVGTLVEIQLVYRVIVAHRADANCYDVEQEALNHTLSEKTYDYDDYNIDVLDTNHSYLPAADTELYD